MVRMAISISQRPGYRMGPIVVGLGYGLGPIVVEVCLQNRADCCRGLVL